VRQLEIKEFLPANEGESVILKQLSSEPNHIDEICRRSGLSTAEVSSTLAILELKGIVKQIGNMNYVLAQRISIKDCPKGQKSE
jgi:DNA processing protein